MILIDPEKRNRLVLYPIDIRYRFQDPQKFVGMLRDIGFARDSQPGEQFMKCLTFLGCSPSVNSGENQSYNNYSIEIVDTASELTLITSPRLRAPACPVCGSRNEEKTAAENIDENEIISWTCSGCGQRIPVGDINWRHKLAVATHYIVVHGVFEGEVVPSDRLLDQLSELTGTSWSYCYC